MTPAQIKELVETLRACGVTHFKDGELDLTLGPAPHVPQKEEKEIVDKAQGYAAQFFDDKILLDKIFPVGGTEESVTEA